MLRCDLIHDVVSGGNYSIFELRSPEGDNKDTESRSFKFSSPGSKDSTIDTVFQNWHVEVNQETNMKEAQSLRVSVVSSFEEVKPHFTGNI